MNFHYIVRAIVSFPFSTQCAETLQGASTIHSGREVFESGTAVGDCRQHGVAVGYGLIARQTHTSRDVLRGLNGDAGVVHPAININGRWLGREKLRKAVSGFLIYFAVGVGIETWQICPFKAQQGRTANRY